MPLRPNPAEAVDDGGGEADTAHNFRVRIRSAWYGGAEVNKTAYRLNDFAINRDRSCLVSWAKVLNLLV